MDKNFRENVQGIAQQGMDILSEYFKGGPSDPQKVNSALRALTLGVKVEHMNQIKDHGDKSLALRVFQFLPKEGQVRKRYLEMTHPEIKPLLPRPKK